MKVNSSIVQKQTQTLAITQAMQQALKILQCSQLELENEISAFLDENIMIEQDVADDFELDLHDHEDLNEDINHNQNDELIDLDNETSFEVIADWNSYEDSGGTSDQGLLSPSDEDNDDYATDRYDESLEDYLLQQLTLVKLSEKDFVIGTFLIDGLDENGYFSQPLQAIVEAINEQYLDWQVEADEVMAVLRHIQQFDPIGIGSMTLEDALIQQIKQLEPVPYWREEAIDLLSHHVPWLLQHDLKRIEKTYGFLEEEVIEMLEGFKRLNPYPAADFRFQRVDAVKPDVIVIQSAGQLTVTLNEELLPKLRINRKYARLAQRAKMAQRDLLRSQLTDARFFLKSIEDRFDTLLKVATAIVDAQQAFFIHGEKAMKSLRMQDIANAVDLNESTISRAVAGKYLICARGTFALNFFFTNQVSEGDDVSSIAIRAVLQELIDHEPKQKPYSDQKLQTLLADKGHDISRRTVAKYREMLGISSSSKRKQLV